MIITVALLACAFMFTLYSNEDSAVMYYRETKPLQTEDTDSNSDVTSVESSSAVASTSEQDCEMTADELGELLQDKDPVER